MLRQRISAKRLGFGDGVCCAGSDADMAAPRMDIRRTGFHLITPIPQSITRLPDHPITRCGDHAVGRKYSTIPAPIDASRNPTKSIGLIAAFGGWMAIVNRTLTMGAPPNTSGITYTGKPPVLNAQMMQAAPAAPSAPAMVAVMRPVVSNPDRLPCADRPATGMMTPIRKYATPTHRSALSGLPSCVCPMCRSAPYAPQDRTAPATKMTHPIDFLV